MAKKNKRLLFGAAFFFNVLILLTLEGAFRFKAHSLFKCENTPEMALNLNDHFVFYSHPGIRYVLCPNMEMKLLSQKLTTNDQGFRDRPFTVSKKKLRVAGIGDSVMMGWGVKDRENFFHLNENQFEEVEFYNFAIAGYSAFQQYYLVRDYVMKYQPDLVVLSYVGNDWEDFPSQNLAESPSFSYLLNYILVHLEKHKEWKEWRPYPKLGVQPQNLVEAYSSMAEILKSFDIPVILVLDSRYQSPLAPHAMIEELGKFHGFEVLNLFSHFQRDTSLQVHDSVNIEDEHNKLYLIPGDGHPNKAWHQAVSALLVPLIEKHLQRKN